LTLPLVPAPPAIASCPYLPALLLSIPCSCCGSHHPNIPPALDLQSPIEDLLSSGAGISYAALFTMSLQQIRSSAQLLGVAQANKYSSVDEMVPGIGAFLAEVRVLLCDLKGGCRMP
jgi:hypothetical protein